MRTILDERKARGEEPDPLEFLDRIRGSEAAEYIIGKGYQAAEEETTRTGQPSIHSVHPGLRDAEAGLLGLKAIYDSPALKERISRRVEREQPGEMGSAVELAHDEVARDIEDTRRSYEDAAFGIGQTIYGAISPPQQVQQFLEEAKMVRGTNEVPMADLSTWAATRLAINLQGQPRDAWEFLGDTVYTILNGLNQGGYWIEREWGKAEVDHPEIREKFREIRRQLPGPLETFVSRFVSLEEVQRNEEAEKQFYSLADELKGTPYYDTWRDEVARIAWTPMSYTEVGEDGQEVILGKLQAGRELAEIIQTEKDPILREARIQQSLEKNLSPIQELVGNVILDPLNFVGAIFGKVSRANMLTELTTSLPPGVPRTATKIVEEFVQGADVLGQATRKRVLGRVQVPYLKLTRQTGVDMVADSIHSTVQHLYKAVGGNSVDDLVRVIRTLGDDPEAFVPFFKEGYVTEPQRIAQAFLKEADLNTIMRRALRAFAKDELAHGGKPSLAFLGHYLEELDAEVARTATRFFQPELDIPQWAKGWHQFTRGLRPWAGVAYLANPFYVIRNAASNVVNLMLVGLGGLRNILPSNRLQAIEDTLGYIPKVVQRGFGAAEGVRGPRIFGKTVPIIGHWGNLIMDTASGKRLIGEAGQRAAGMVNALNKGKFMAWRNGIMFEVPERLLQRLGREGARALVRGFSQGNGPEEFHRVVDRLRRGAINVGKHIENEEVPSSFVKQVQSLADDFTAGKITMNDFLREGKKLWTGLDNSVRQALAEGGLDVHVYEEFFMEMFEEAPDVAKVLNDYHLVRKFIIKLNQTGELRKYTKRLVRDIAEKGFLSEKITDYNIMTQWWYRDSSLFKLAPRIFEQLPNALKNMPTQAGRGMRDILQGALPQYPLRKPLADAFWNLARQEQVPEIQRLIEDLARALKITPEQLIAQSKEMQTLIRASGDLNFAEVFADTARRAQRIITRTMDDADVFAKRGVQEAVEGAEVHPSVWDELHKWIDDDLVKSWNSFTPRLEGFATDLVKSGLFDYNKRWNADTIASLGVPYHFWLSRAMELYAAQVVRNPGFFSFLFKIQRALENLNEGVPARYRRQVPLTQLTGIKHPITGEDVYVDLLPLLFPVVQVPPFNALHYRDLSSDEEVSGLWKALDDLQQIAGTRPWFFLELPAQLAFAPQKERERSYWLTQITPGLKGISAALKETWPQPFSWVPEGGINLESGEWLRTPDGQVLGGPNIRQGLGMLNAPYWDYVYWPMQHLSFMVTEGVITEEEALEAAKSYYEGKSNSAWLTAYQRASANRGWSVIGAWLFGARTNVYEESEKVLRSLYSKLREAGYDPNTNPAGSGAAVRQIYENHPELGIRSLAFVDTEEGKKAALDRVTSSLFWKNYNAIMTERDGALEQAILKDPAVKFGELSSIRDKYRELVGEFPQDERSLLNAPRGATPQEYRDYMKEFIMGWLNDDLFSYLGDAEGEERRELEEEYWKLARGRPWIEELASLTVEAFQDPDRPQYTGYDPVRTVWPKVENTTEEEVGRYISRLLAAENLKTYWARNDTPIVAAHRVWNEQVYGPAWEKYNAQVAAGASSSTAMRRTIRAVADMPAAELILLIMQEYPGRWTERQLREELGNLVFPSPYDVWQSRKEGQPAAAREEREVQLSAENQAALDAHDVARERAGFPDNVYDLQKTYYALDSNQAKRAFLNQNPTLERYWEWNREYKGNHSEYLEATRALLSPEERAAEEFEATLPPRLSPPEEAALRAHDDARRAAGFPDDILFLQDAYYKLDSSASKRAFREAYPMLPAYWDWNRQYKAGHQDYQEALFALMSPAEAFAERFEMGLPEAALRGRGGGVPTKVGTRVTEEGQAQIFEDYLGTLDPDIVQMLIGYLSTTYKDNYLNLFPRLRWWLAQLPAEQLGRLLEGGDLFEAFLAWARQWRELPQFRTIPIGRPRVPVTRYVGTFR